MPDSAPRRSRLSTERLEEVFGAVRELLLEVGYERLTFDAVAARAHSSKATLYRQWGGKPGLVLAALTQGEAKHPPLVSDLETLSLDEAFAQLIDSGRLSGQGLQLGLMLLQAASTDPEFAAALRAEIIEPGLTELAAVFEAAADRGEIVRDPPLFARLAYVVLTSFAFASLISGREDSRAELAELFRTVIRSALTFTI